jgi:hypothetical protein
VADRELAKGTRVENDGALVGQETPELLGGNLGRRLAGFCQGSLEDIPDRLSLRNDH